MDWQLLLTAVGMGAATVGFLWNFRRFWSGDVAEDLLERMLGVAMFDEKSAFRLLRGFVGDLLVCLTFFLNTTWWLIRGEVAAPPIGGWLMASAGVSMVLSATLYFSGSPAVLVPTWARSFESMQKRAGIASDRSGTET